MKTAAVILGGLLLLAIGAGAALFLAQGPRTPSAPPPQPAPASTPAPPAPATTPLPQTVDFIPLVQDFTLLRDSAAYVAASQNAPQFYPLKAGTGVVSAARSPDGSWTVAMTQDGRAAFLPSADLGPYDPARTPQPPLPPTVSGPAQVIDTATLVVGGQTVSLEGVLGSKDPFAADMQSAIDARGSNVACSLQPSGRYICTMPDGADLARTALFNGGARLSDDASADYRAQAESARAGRRGVWK